jgi:hypothetical protein
MEIPFNINKVPFFDEKKLVILLFILLLLLLHLKIEISFWDLFH